MHNETPDTTGSTPQRAHRRPGRYGLAAALVLLAGCSAVENFVNGDKVDYKANAARNKALDVPPDLTQLSRDPRYQPQGGTISASDFQTAASSAAASQGAAPGGQTVAALSVGDLHIERAGNSRWLVTSLTPDQLWPKLHQFWQEQGMELTQDDAAAGVMETDWKEDRSKLPNDFIRNTIGKVFDSLYSTGQLDKYRTRVEPVPGGSEVYISHRGLEEISTGPQHDQTRWQPRAPDPQLEGEFLSRLMVALSTPNGSPADKPPAAVAQAASAAVTNAVSPPARARIVGAAPATTLQVDDDFDRAWRRVGLALDRTGFTVEDRDRSGGLYFVRYVDPANAGKEEPGFFSRLFKGASATGPVRYRISVKSDGGKTLVSVLNSQGAPETGDAGQKILALLLDDLK